MDKQHSSTGEANAALARTLAFAVDHASRPRHHIAQTAGVHRETLLRAVRGERTIGLDEAARILAACGANPRATIILALSGQEDLACEWIGNEMCAFLDGLICALPQNLVRVLGSRVDDVRPRWASGTSQLVARLLAKHIDQFANHDFSSALER